MSHLSQLFGKDELLKKSIILLKAWFTYESSFLGSYAACLATYALYVLIVFILNNHHAELATPLDVLRTFFRYWGTFDWDNSIATIYSPIRAQNYYERVRAEVSKCINSF